MKIRPEIANRQTHEERDKRANKQTYKQADKCSVKHDLPDSGNEQGRNKRPNSNCNDSY